jgi:F0F1-type ATP synthase membrane subunit c/vacuolar-type H+-ATPase subunit K
MASITPAHAPTGSKLGLSRKAIILIVAAVVVVLAIVGTVIGIEVSRQNAAKAAAEQSATARGVFLQQYRDTFPNSPATDDQAVGLGRSICSDYASGTTFINEVQYLRSFNSALTAGNAGALIGMSTASFCPEFNNRH